MSMDIWNAQKVGQSVIDTSSMNPSTGTETPKTFKKILVGAGNDERPLYGRSLEEEEDINYAALSKIDMYLRQKTLLEGLSSGQWSMVEKTERIRLAASYENLLPSSLASKETSITQSSLSAGGLYQDWDFQF